MNTISMKEVCILTVSYGLGNVFSPTYCYIFTVICSGQQYTSMFCGLGNVFSSTLLLTFFTVTCSGQQYTSMFWEKNTDFLQILYEKNSLNNDGQQFH